MHINTLGLVPCCGYCAPSSGDCCHESRLSGPKGHHTDAVDDHRLRIADRSSRLWAAVGHGLFPTADAIGNRLGPLDLRACDGIPEPVLGHEPADLRRAGRQVWHRPRAGDVRPSLCGRPCRDGLCGSPALAACRRRHSRRHGHRRRVLQRRAVGIRKACDTRAALDGVRHRHGGWLCRNVPVCPCQPGADQPLRLVRQPGHHGRHDAGCAPARLPLARQLALRQPERCGLPAERRRGAARSFRTRATSCWSPASSSAAIRSPSSPRIFPPISAISASMRVMR